MKRWWIVAALFALQIGVGAARADQDWRDVDPDDLMLIDVKYGRIAIEHLPPSIRSFISEKKIPRPVLGDEGLDLNTAVEEFENRLIEEALRRTKGNKQAAARLLGLKRTTLVAKLRRRRGEEGDDTADEQEAPE